MEKRGHCSEKQGSCSIKPDYIVLRPLEQVSEINVEEFGTWTTKSLEWSKQSVLDHPWENL